MVELETYNDFRPSVVIPVGPGEFRIKNLHDVLATLEQQVFKPKSVAIVCDGFDIAPDDLWKNESGILDLTFICTPKHEPGREQPRNIGVRLVEKYSPESNYVWFLDSDCLAEPETLHEFAKASKLSDENRVLIGPYEWMKPKLRELHPEIYNDPRWEMFNRHEAHETFYADLGVALGCFSGNLVWPIEEFKWIGGFWNELYTGRCEDGELGIRASALGVPMGLVKTARAYHMGPMGGHGDPLILQKNQRDIPMINERHPYVEKEGLVVVDEDGKRFNQICKWCGESINTGAIWYHPKECYNYIDDYNVLDNKTRM